jgi:formylglycine-generating enzyme required for sulfatase activity
MRSSRIAVLAALIAAGVSACGEEEKKAGIKGELIVALQTDMDLPKDVDKVRIRVASYGNTIFSNDYPVGPSELRIPATLAIFGNPERPSAPATIQIIGFRVGKPRVMRESITTVPLDRIATLRMPIEWLCDDSARSENNEVISQCPSEQTCVAGTCAAAFVDSEDLPDFKPEEIFGGGTGPGSGTCFDTAQCFSNAVRATPATDACVTIIPGRDPNLNVALKPSGSGDGICTGGVCLIPLDGGEGGQWTRSDATLLEGEPATQVQLAPGVCEKLKAGKIEAVVVSTACATKTTQNPPCGAWSSTGGGGMTIDAGVNMGDAGIGGDDAATRPDSGAMIDGGVGMPDTSRPDGSVPETTMPPDANPIDDAGGGKDGVTTIDAGTGIDAGGAGDASRPPDVCMADCGVPINCQPPPPPADGGKCEGVTSMPAHNANSICQWDVPGGIATTGGAGFCGNLVNLNFIDLPGSPGPSPIHQVPEGQCQDGPGWQFTPGKNVIDLCPASCNPVRDFGTQVQFVYGCPSSGGPSPDGGFPIPPDAPPPPDGGTQPPDVSTDGGPQPPIVPILGGTFNMGCAPTDSACNNDELPLHSVTLSDFSVDQTEVTQAAYDQCIKASVCVAPPCSSWDPTMMGANPVTCVNWQEALNYCTWMGRRLPTEAEWEIAAHGTDGRIYPWGFTEPDCMHANFSSCALDGPSTVVSFPSGISFYNAHDMAGNVAEWVFDWYGVYETGGGTNPTGPTSGSMKIVRGGDFSSTSAELRTSHRVQMDANTRNDNIGFRCAKPGF